MKSKRWPRTAKRMAPKIANSATPSKRATAPTPWSITSKRRSRSIAARSARPKPRKSKRPSKRPRKPWRKTIPSAPTPRSIGSPPPPPSDGGQPKGGKDDVVDAEFVDVDDKDKK